MTLLRIDRNEALRSHVNLGPMSRAVADEINDDDIVVGWDDINPYRWMPTGDNQWGEAEILEKPVPFAPGRVQGMSDHTYAVGYVTEFTGPRGVVWNVHTGKIVGDFGAGTRAIGINDAGTIAWGEAGGFEPEPAIWERVGKDWSLVTQQNLADLIGPESPVLGAGQWGSFRDIIDVNDHGQVLGRGRPLFSTENRFFVLDVLLSSLKSDVNNDGTVDFLDITPFVNLLDEVAGAVPEPASAALLIIGLVTMRRRTR